LYTEGKSFQQIARELESSVKTVKGWVTGRKG
jgi:DNA-binding NarL/FixJ family response regulator